MMKLGLIACVSLFFAGCATAPDAGTMDYSSHCIFQQDREAKRTMEFAGAKVGFCCQKCEGKFQGMTDEAKQAAIAKLK